MKKSSSSLFQTCPNCPVDETRRVFSVGSGSPVVRCRSCGIEFTREYPDIAGKWEEIYPARYFERALASSEYREKIFEELLKELESILGRSGRLLDVGAGDGSLIAAALKRGWHPEGTEISKAMVDFIRKNIGVPVYEGELENLALRADSYDAVILNHVLEHVRNPRRTLELVSRLLRSGGVVRVEVPNLGSFSSRCKNVQSKLRLKRNPWKHYSTGHHFWFFRPDTLKATAARAGLDPFLVRAPAKQWERKNAVVRMLNVLYTRTLWGGHLVLYARRGDGKRKPPGDAHHNGTVRALSHEKRRIGGR